jgi:hypothetical protein
MIRSVKRRHEMHSETSRILPIGGIYPYRSLINIYIEREIDLYKMWLGFQALATRLATLHNSAMPGPPHALLTTQTQMHSVRR